MNCFSQRFRQTAPMLGSSKNELVPSKPPRRNGWSWPPQAFQVVGWLVYSYLTIVSFGIYIPLLPLPWKHVAYTVSLTHSGSFLFEYGANISLCWVFFLSFFVCAAEQDKDFVVWHVCMGFSHTQCDRLSFSGLKDIISGLFVSCWMPHDVNHKNSQCLQSLFLMHKTCTAVVLSY